MKWPPVSAESTQRLLRSRNAENNRQNDEGLQKKKHVTALPPTLTTHSLRPTKLRCWRTFKQTLSDRSISRFDG